MRIRHQHIPDIPRRKVKRPTRRWRLIHRDPRLALQKITLLIRRRMPMHFAHRACLNLDQRDRKCARNRKRHQVQHLDTPARHTLRPSAD
jgi:hypothetical protein